MRFPGRIKVTAAVLLGLALYNFPDELSKLPHILLSRIERAHPAHHGVLFVPYIEEVTLLQLGNRRSWDLGKNSVGLHFVNNLHLRDFSEFFLQQTRHAIGVLRTLQPEIAAEQGIKLRRNEAHFGRELHPLLAQIQEVVAQLLVEENDSLSAQGAILGSTERKYVHAQVARGLPQGLPQTRGSVCNAGPVHVQEHPALVSKEGEGAYFGRLVHSPYFSGLRDRDNAGLHVVRIIDAMVGVTDGVDG